VRACVRACARARVVSLSFYHCPQNTSIFISVGGNSEPMKTIRKATTKY